MQIFVKVSTSKTITIDVQPIDTIEQLMARIFDQEGILPEEQTLFYADQQLMRNKILYDYKIVNESTILLFSTDVVKVVIKYKSTNKTITLILKSSETIGVIKRKLFEEEKEIPVDLMMLSFCGKLLNEGFQLYELGRPELTLDLSSGNTIRIHVIVNINDYTNYCNSRSCIADNSSINVGSNSNNHSNDKTNNSKSNGDDNSNSSDIYFSVNSIGCRTIDLEIDVYLTVLELKRLIEGQLKIDANSQILSHKNKVLLDEWTLKYVGLNNEAEVVLKIGNVVSNENFLLQK